MNGTAVPNIDLSTTAKLSAAQAGERAIAQVIANPPRDARAAARAFLSGADLTASARLFVYRIGLVRGVPGTNQLVYEVEVTNGTSVREIVYRARARRQDRQPLLDDLDDALFRRLFEEHRHAQIWQEGDPFPGTLNADQQNIVNFSGHSYYLFFNAFGRDSYDGAGAEMRSVNNDPRSTARTRTGTAPRRTTAPASPPTTWSPTSGATPTPSSRTT